MTTGWNSRKGRFRGHERPAPSATPPVPGIRDGDPADLRGVVERVRVVNEVDAWGFGGLYVKQHAAVVDFNGPVADIFEGGDARVQGVWNLHPRYGWQIKGRLITAEVPETGHGARAWMSHRFENVGPVLAARLVSAFPVPELWRVIEECPERLQEVEGVGPAVADTIVRGFHTWKFEREQFETLAGLGLKPAQIRKAVDRWGREASARIHENPYCLRQLPGLGWKLADATAFRMGVKSADPRRVVAGVGYAMELLEREGDTCATDKAIRAMAAGADVLRLPHRRVAEVWPVAVAEGAVVAGNGYFYRPTTLAQETAIAEGIAALLGRAT